MAGVWYVREAHIAGNNSHFRRARRRWQSLRNGDLPGRNRFTLPALFHHSYSHSYLCSEELKIVLKNRLHSGWIYTSESIWKWIRCYRHFSLITTGPIVLVMTRAIFFFSETDQFWPEKPNFWQKVALEMTNDD